MKIAVGADHAGFKQKQYLLEELRRQGYEVIDMGTYSEEPVDYPDEAREVSQAVHNGQAERGILVCGTGLGMSIAANKVPGIRAVVVHDEYTAIVSRSHNDANVLCLGGRVLDPDHALRLAELWLKTKYEGGRHQKRIDKITEIESNSHGT